MNCNETEKICNMTIDYGKEKIIVEFDKFRSHVYYEYTNSKLSSETAKFYFQLETDSKIKKQYMNETTRTAYRTFENSMTFDFSDIYRLNGTDGKTIIDKTDFTNNKLVIQTKNITIRNGKKFVLDPDWTTPSGIHSTCGTNTNNLIDGKTSDDVDASYHYVSELHYVVFDMGSSVDVQQVRFYMGDYYGGDYSLGNGNIYVSDDTGNWGSAVSTDFCAAAADNWATIDTTDKSGRYIKIEFYTVSTAECLTSDGFWKYSNLEPNDGGFLEFEAYIVVADTTPPTYSDVSHNNTIAGQPTEFSVKWNDETALQTAGQWIFSTNNTGTWTNDTAVNFTATPEWANVTKTLNSTVGLVIGYKWYAKDNAGNWNTTSVFTLTTTSAGTPDIEYSINSNTGATKIMFLNCSDQWTYYPTYPQYQNATYGIINATNNGTATGDFQIEYVGTLRNGWTLYACNASSNDPKNSADCITLSDTMQTIWNGVTSGTQKDIWLYGNCSYVTGNPNVDINMTAVS